MDSNPSPNGADSTAAPSEPAWEPGPPSIRNLLPSIIFGAVVPLSVYYLARHHVHSDADALIIAGIPAALWVIVQFIRDRHFDPVGLVVLFGFAIGVVTSTLLGGNAYVLKVRDSAFTAIFGLACLVSVFRSGRPIIFYVGRVLSAGNEPEKVAAYDQLYEMPTGAHTFRVLTIVWGVGLLLEATSRLILAAFIPTGPFLAISPCITGVCLGSMFLFTVRYSARARTDGEAMLEEGQAYPSVPLR